MIFWVVAHLKPGPLHTPGGGLDIVQLWRFMETSRVILLVPCPLNCFLLLCCLLLYSAYYQKNYEIYTLHKIKRHISSQNHITMEKRNLITYKLYTPSSIYRCGITHPNTYKFITWFYQFLDLIVVVQIKYAVGWGCFEMGYGRKIDPEPGRCRRTDGKKWRCSKEAYPDSKYCERHMHRGKNKSKKTSTCSSTISCSVSSSNDECAINYHPLMPDKTQVQSFHTTTTPSVYPFMSTQSSSLSTHNCTESTQQSSIAPHWLFDSQSYDQPNKQMRFVFFFWTLFMKLIQRKDLVWWLRLGVFNGLGAHFEHLSGSFLEALCKDGAENGLYYN